MEFDEEITAYERSRDRVTALVAALGDEQLATTVPCCPRWTVKDLVGHLAGVAEDRDTGRMPTGGFEEWTDDQVSRHREESMDQVLVAWESLDLARNDAVPSLSALAFDAVVHEHDLFHALSAPCERDNESVRVGARRASDRMAAVLAGTDAPGVVLRTEDGERRLDGNGQFVALDAGRFDFMRLVTGRMSERQALALAWDDDPSPVLGILFADGFFSLQPSDVIEADESR
jgi:uncharacterized protein (TIGR03083 family)